MERTVALKRLRKIFGKQFAWQFNSKAAGTEEREAAKAAQPAILAEYKAAGEALQARMAQVLDSDEEYQRLKVRIAAARKAKEENSGILLVDKISVGTANSMFFHVEASGQSWEEIFEILKKRGKS